MGTIVFSSRPVTDVTNDGGAAKRPGTHQSSNLRKIDVTDTSTDAMQNIFDETWLRPYPYRGYDASGLTHQRMKVKAVYKLINKPLRERYLSNVTKYRTIAKQLRRGRFMQIDAVQDALAQNPILTEQLRAIDPDDYPCDDKINEVYLFHGTSKENVDGIFENGFMLQKAKEALYGKALYFAESAQKSDQYPGINCYNM